MKRAWAVVAATVLLAGVGCSDGEAEEGLTKAEFLDQATEVCEAAGERIAERSEDLDPEDPAAFSDFVVFVSTEVLDQIRALRELGFLEGDEQLLNQALSVYEDRFERWQDAPGEAVEAATDKELQAAGKVLEDYGIPACGADV